MRKPELRSKSKEKLLDAAEELMLIKGFAATSVDEICREAKLTKGSFFHYFENKEHLGKAVLERFCSSSRQKMQEECCPKEGDPLKRVYNYADFAIKMAKDPKLNKGCLIGKLAQELSDTYPQIRSLCANGFNEWAKMLKKDLKEAKNKYAPKASFEVESLAEHFIAILEGSQVLAKAKRDNRIVERNMQHFKQYLKNLFKR